MNILAIGLDPMLLDPASVAMKRQHAYYRGHDATIVILRPGATSDFQEKGLRIRTYGGKSKPEVFLRALYGMMREGKRPDLIIAQDVLFTGLLGYLMKRHSGGQLVTQLHGDYLDNPKWITESAMNSALNVLGKWILSQSDGVRTVSTSIEDFITTKLKYPKEKTISIPIGTELTLFSPDGVKASVPGRYVMFAQRLIPEKSPMYYVSIMIDLMRKYPDLHAVIAGEGFLRKDMEAQFRNAGLHERAHFLGQVGMASLASYYRGAVCLLHTAGWEGWGMPMIEAMSAGAPVVTTKTGCAGEAVLHDRNGIITPIDDVEGMRRGVERLLVEPETRERMSAFAREDAQVWSFESLSERLRAWYEERATSIHHG
jgi:glycosyltransferase involved in cell wall biosynthesis